MGKVAQSDETVKVNIDVSVSFDDSGSPVSATGKKELTESDGGEADRTPDTLNISDDARSKFNTSIADANAKYKKALEDAGNALSADRAAAESALDEQLVAENYTAGVFTPTTA